MNGPCSFQFLLIYSEIKKGDGGRTSILHSHFEFKHASLIKLRSPFF